MTTHSDVTASDQRAGTWKPLPPPFSKYEVSPDGFGPDQRPVRRIGRDPLATTVNNHGGYLMVKPYDDNGRRSAGKTVHALVLLAYAGPCPPGMESRHLDDDPLNNRWAPGDTDDEVRANGGNLVYGTKRQNAEDKFDNGHPRAAPPPPPRPCVRCGAMFAAKGRRCPACLVTVGRQAAVMLRAGLNLRPVTFRVGYRSEEWVHTLACRHGGYAGTLEQAQAQGRSRPQRVTATLRYRLRIGVR